tara:strand:- start:158 stop:280 length:123 start_codon:yes stop_codon:yes gene_type:complete
MDVEKRVDISISTTVICDASDVVGCDRRRAGLSNESHNTD